MRDLQRDYDWLVRNKRMTDLSDELLSKRGCATRKEVESFYEIEPGITFVESDIAIEWLKRAIEAEKKLNLTLN